MKSQDQFFSAIYVSRKKNDFIKIEIYQKFETYTLDFGEKLNY